MDKLLSVVEEVFEITVRGCILIPGIPLDTPHVVKIRAPIRLLRPDGSTVETYVAGIEMISATPPRPGPIPILLPPELRKSDIPVGTQVFLT